MITLVGLKACDTCRKALKELSAAGHTAELRDVRAAPVTREEVAAWADILGSALLNTRSTTWRGLSEDERTGDPVSLMVAHPTLIKRPVVLSGDQTLLGWTPATRAALGL